MAIAYFLDSSALVKRYVQEAGTPWVRGITLVSADQALNDAALAEGLGVDDPTKHP